MTDVFLSYSSKDRERVRPIRDALAAAGYDVFWDIDIPPGENWDALIRRRMMKASTVVVCWSRNSAASMNVQHEAAIAREDGKLTPVFLEPMKAIELPMGFYNTQAVSLDGWTGQEGHPGFETLIRVINARLSDVEIASGSEDGVETADVRDTTAEEAQHPEPPHIAEIRRRVFEGDAEAQTDLGERYNRGREVPYDLKEAARLYALAAKQGHPRAQAKLALMYEYGLGGVRSNLKKAQDLLHAAAETGLADAQNHLGALYQRYGEGAEAQKLSARYYRLAADQGHASAMSSLAGMYSRGEGGLEQNDNEAVRLWLLAAEQGNKSALYNLALMHEAGKGGLPKDEAETVRYFRLAAAQKHVEARQALKKRGLAT
jgi:TPR repeat protein